MRKVGSGIRFWKTSEHLISLITLLHPFTMTYSFHTRGNRGGESQKLFLGDAIDTSRIVIQIRYLHADFSVGIYKRNAVLPSEEGTLYQRKPLL